MSLGVKPTCLRRGMRSSAFAEKSDSKVFPSVEESAAASAFILPVCKDELPMTSQISPVQLLVTT